ncbi:replication protein [Salmonella enterica]|uniref:Replication protein n=1 Tax=Salmonella enterica I TaxID=59201 RepID=A0A7Z1T193_SALET|nr:replication protein [Salmonella enterica]PTU33503.1 replication protein [Salmonella enterica subsp. enterica]
MENQKQGHFSLFRSLLSKEWAKDTAKLAMWIRLIGEASYKHRTVEFSGREWNLNPGELVTTAAIMGRKLRDQDGHEKSPQAVTRMINFFAREGMITTKGTRFGTVITITNYGQYQEISPDEPRDKPSDKQNKKVVNKKVVNKKVVNKKVVNNNKTPLPPKGGCDEGSKPEKRKPTKINYSEYLAAYNEIVGDRLPHAVEVNSERQRKLKKLIDSLATKNIDGFRAYVKAFMAAARPFHFGDNDRDWVANFDYLLRPKVLIAIREGTL